MTTPAAAIPVPTGAFIYTVPYAVGPIPQLAPGSNWASPPLNFTLQNDSDIVFIGNSEVGGDTNPGIRMEVIPMIDGVMVPQTFVSDAALYTMTGNAVPIDNGIWGIRLPGMAFLSSLTAGAHTLTVEVYNQAQAVNPIIANTSGPVFYMLIMPATHVNPQ